jgi:porin
MDMRPAGIRIATALAGIALATYTVLAPARGQTAGAAPLSPYGAILSTMGIVPNITYIGEFAANPNGGAGQGGEFAGTFAIGADVDLQKLMGLTGGAFHIEFTDRQGRNLANDTINSSVSVQENYGGGQTYFLTTLTYEQKLLGGIVDLQFGRTELGGVAFQDPIYCEFQSNNFCGEPAVMGKLINASYYPVPVWAGYATITPTAKTYFILGLFDNAPTESEPQYHGVNFSIDASEGAQIPLEAGYQTTFKNDNYPRRYDVGVILDRTPYSFTTYDPATKQLDSTDGFGRTMLYAQAKQMVYRPDMTSERGLTVFGAVAFGPDANQQANYGITAGAVYLGPFASRPMDSIGVAVGDTHYRDSYIDQLYAYRVNALDGSQRPASDLIMAEINYKVAPTPWLSVMPNIQYIDNPDSLGALPYPRSNLRNAFVFGLQIEVDAAVLSGLAPAK